MAHNNTKEKVISIRNQLIEITREFCINRINVEYADLCEKLISKLARKRSVPFVSGKISIWAASVIWTVGRVNFLGDKSFEPYLELKELAEHFGTSKSTIGQKAGKISEMLKIQYYDPEFSTSHMAEKNPFARMVVDGNGFIHVLDSSI